VKRVRFIAITSVAIYLLAVPGTLGQGGYPAGSTKESGKSAGKDMTAAEQTGKKAAQNRGREKKVVEVDSAKATFRQVRPGVSKAMLWGDDTKGPYGAFTKFNPGLTNPLHTHTNDIRLVVLKGAYVYKPQNGDEKRVGPGQYLFVPGGDRHVSGGDQNEGALFYEESPGKFDFKPVNAASGK
jgi:mannose-6-phosphate isomerase-like protein (cupin superfamily)